MYFCPETLQHLSERSEVRQSSEVVYLNKTGVLLEEDKHQILVTDS